MGTQLYAKGVFLNRSFDELNLSAPELVREVHEEYLRAGAEIVESNTFGANRIKLEPHGLAERVREINAAGVRIARDAASGAAYVGGSVGPLGIRIEPYGKTGIDEAREIFAEQIAALVEAGVDLLCLETFSDLNEIRAAVAAAREFRLPIMAQMTLEEDGNSLEGTPPESFGPELERSGADVIGVNCGVGPQVMLEGVERLASSIRAKLVAQPNAGKPRSFEGRNIYLSSPEYMASYAKRFVRAGVRVVGGCCGTTPAHIQAIGAAVRALRGAPPVVVTVVSPSAAAPEQAAPSSARSELERRIEAKLPVAVVDLSPPTGGDPGEALEEVKLLVGRGVDAVKVSEAPRASAPMGALAFAALVQSQVGLEAILHYACRDRTLLQMQSELLGAHALGLRNFLLTTGEPLWIGDYIDATRVFDVDSIGLTRLVAGLNRGRDIGGKAIPRPTRFFAGVFVDPGALGLDEEIRRFEYKVEAGARFAITTAIFRPELLEQFLRRTRHCRIPVIAGILPLGGQGEAEFLNNEVPGMSIPEAMVARLQAAGSPEAGRRAGIEIARELVRQVRGMVEGVQVSVRGGRCSTALEILG
ncbi:MAG: bifunctional homocysteine S-methyltransferase/methylenetetrahydrofolate reductase [Acidobacteria bacterium]|nr:MAG: bifunctional homocysteine S-methyltransferase/methylenetetrahydrofolate reductase [Acidobacteriota bacterium]